MLKPKDYGRLLSQNFRPQLNSQTWDACQEAPLLSLRSSSHNWRWRRFNCALTSLSFHRLPHTLPDQCFVNCPVTSLSSYALQI